MLVVLALPGRRAQIDDDLPDEAVAVPAQPVDGEGRRARRLRAQAEAEAEAESEGEQPPNAPPVPATASGTPEDNGHYADPYAEPPADQNVFDRQPYAAVPQQQQYGEWDGQQTYPEPGYSPAYGQEPYPYGGEGTYGNEQYQQPYQADPYQNGGYGEGGQYQGGRYAEGRYAEGQYQDDQYGNEPHADGRQYPEGQYPQGQYPDGRYDPYLYEGEQDRRPGPNGNHGNTTRGESE